MRIPKYRRHATGQAFVQHKSRRTYLGVYGSDESRKRYAEFVARLAAEAPPTPAARKEITVAEAVAEFLQHAAAYYAGGQEALEHGYALAPVLDLYASEPLENFGPRALAAAREKMIQSGLARTVINQRVYRIRHWAKWLVAQELAPPEWLVALKTLEPLKKGKTTARETVPVRAVAPEHVKAALQFLSPTVKALVLTQWLCGMRPGEARRMRACEIDRTGPVWVYQPSQHKNQWRGETLVKAIPKVVQEILQPLIASREPDAYLFSPHESDLWHRAQRVKPDRKTKVYPCETRRLEAQKAKTRPRGRVGYFTKDSYANAIRRACRKAGVPSWHPNQLRHQIATAVSAQTGQQKAQRWLGHSRLETTAIYAELDRAELIQLAHALDAELAKLASPTHSWPPPAPAAPSPASGPEDNPPPPKN